MALGYNLISSIPYLSSYEMAATHEASVKPIRGDANGTKPLGHRKWKWINIKREEPSGDIVIGYGYGGSEMLRYKPNGEVHLTMGRYAYATNNQIMECILGTSIRTAHSRVWITCATPKFDYGWVPLPYNKVTILARRKSGNSRWYIAKPEYPSSHKLNMPKYNQVKKRHAKFLRYAKGIFKLFDKDHAAEAFSAGAVALFGGIEQSTYSGVKVQPAYPEPSVAELYAMLASDNIEEWHKAAFLISLYASGQNRYYWWSYNPSNPSGSFDRGLKWSYNPSNPSGSFDRGLKDILLRNHPKVFVRQTRKDGKIIRDPYAKYVTKEEQ